MVEEANWYADRLQLPTSRPIQMTDVRYPYVSPAWFSVIMLSNFSFYPDTIFNTNIFNPRIPREQRLQAIRIGVNGTIETTNFFFSFEPGKMWKVQRLSEHDVQYFANDLDKLIGKPSLIDSNSAYQLATQWLSAVDVDVPAMERKYRHEVNCLSVLPFGATNTIVVPMYFVHWGWQYYTNGDDNHSVGSAPLVEVKFSAQPRNWSHSICWILHFRVAPYW